MRATIYFKQDRNLYILKTKKIGDLGYGNVAKSFVLNLRDSGVNVTVGVQTDAYIQRAIKDNFDVKSIQEGTANI